MSAAPRRVGILLGERSNPFWSKMKSQFEVAAERFNIEVVQFQAEIDNDPAAQAAELDRMLDLGFAALIVNPIHGRCLAPGIARAASRGLPVFDVGAKTDGEAVRGWPNYVPVRTVDFYRQGVLGGGFIRERLADRPHWKAAIIEGRPGSAQSRGRSSGAAEALSLDGPDRVAGRVPAYFDRERAAEQAERLLTRWSDINAIFCANDLMALGAADAAAALGRAGLIIVGVDLIPEAAAAIEQGRLAASVAFAPADVARVVLAAVDRYWAGAPLEQGFPVASRVAHKMNLSEFAPFA
ncbi:MAG: substrate-binding domain-containing protein [Pseudomonadota bacterium]